MNNMREQTGYLVTFHRHWSVARHINGDLSLAEYLAMRAKQPDTAIKPEIAVVREYIQDGDRIGVMRREPFEVGTFKNKPYLDLLDSTILWVLANNPQNMVLRIGGKDDISHASQRLVGVDLSTLNEFYFGQVLLKEVVTIVGPNNTDDMVKIRGRRKLQEVIAY